MNITAPDQTSPCSEPSRTRDAQRRVLALSATTSALYVVTWLLEEAMFRDSRVAVFWVLGGAHFSRNGSALWLFALYTITTVLIFWVYGTLISMSLRGELADGRARLWAILVPILLNLIFLAWVPHLSQDVLSYTAQGVLGELPGGNPLVQPVQTAGSTFIGPYLATHDWHTAPGITPYGILWTQLETLIARLSGTNVSAAVLLFKALAALASLGSAWLIWRVLGHINREIQLPGTLAYLWNPLVLTQFGVEAHNDAVMIFLSIASLAAAITCRPVVSLGAQLLGVMSKYICVLFLPPQLVFLWRTRSDARRFVLQMLVALTTICVLLVALYAPFWAGLHSLDGIVKRIYPFGSATFFGVVHGILTHTHTRFSPFAGLLTTAFVSGLLLALIAWFSLHVKTAADLAKSCAWISLAFLLLVNPDYWPWYAGMSIAWICIGDLKRLFWFAFLLSIAGELTDPLDLLVDHGLLDRDLSKELITGVGALLPLLVLLAWGWRHGLRQQIQHRDGKPT